MSSTIKNHIALFLMSLHVCLLASCAGKQEIAQDEAYVFEHEPTNAIYHWKTVLKPNQYEIDFLKTHLVKRLYVKFFDVSTDNLYNGQGEQAVPIATTVFTESL